MTRERERERGTWYLDHTYLDKYYYYIVKMILWQIWEIVYLSSLKSFIMCEQFHMKVYIVETEIILWNYIVTYFNHHIFEYLYDG